MKLNIDALRAALAKPKTAIHCDTEEKAEALFEAMGQTYRVSNACDCYSTDGGIGFSAPRSYFESHGYTILTLDDFILPAKPRLAEVLGVEVGQEFGFDWPGLDGMHRINEEGFREYANDGDLSWDCVNYEAGLIFMINNPHLIRIIPRWTEDDIADADAAMRLYGDFPWIARDKDGTLTVFADRPIRHQDEFTEMYFRELPKSAFPSVRWGNSPVEVREIK